MDLQFCNSCRKWKIKTLCCIRCKDFLYCPPCLKKHYIECFKKRGFRTS